MAESEQIGMTTPFGDVGAADLPFPLFDNSTDREINVLHVDDEEELGEIVKTFVEETDERLSITTAMNVEDGLTYLESDSIDCIVSDYDMPGKNGIEFLERVRLDYPRLPFILYTGKGSEEIASDAIAAGVTDYMQKGVGTDQYELLAKRVVNAVESNRTEQELLNAFAWYRRLVEQNLAGIYVIQDEEYLYVNERFAEIFGYAQADLIGEPAFVTVDEQHHELLRDNLRKRETGEIESIEYSLVGKHKDGSRFDIKVHGGQIEFQGEPAVMGVLLDISDK